MIWIISFVSFALWGGVFFLLMVLFVHVRLRMLSFPSQVPAILLSIIALVLVPYIFSPWVILALNHETHTLLFRDDLFLLFVFISFLLFLLPGAGYLLMSPKGKILHQLQNNNNHSRNNAT